MIYIFSKSIIFTGDIVLFSSLRQNSFAPKFIVIALDLAPLLYQKCHFHQKKTRTKKYQIYKEIHRFSVRDFLSSSILTLF